jgi:WD40 repeat protein
MKYRTIRKISVDERIFSVHVTRDQVLFGGTSKRVSRYTLPGFLHSILCVHKKSIRSITSNGSWTGVSSYDGTATILYNNELIDVVEGPETEVKSLAFNEMCEYIALSTRSGSVWVLKVEGEIEIDTILEDHTHDVKGVKWNRARLYSYGYDNTIKMYEKADYSDGSWELTQSIDGHSSTIWDVGFYGHGEERMVSCSEDGFIYFYEFDGLWRITRKCEASKYPIYSISIINGEYIAYILNRRSVAVVDDEFNLKLVLENLHDSDINSISYCRETSMLVTGGDDGNLSMVEIIFDSEGM